MAGSTGTSARAGFVAGALAASTAVLTLLLLRIVAGGPSLPELVQEGIGLLLLPAMAAGPFGTGRPAEAPVWLTSLIATAVFVATLHALTRSASAAAPDLERRRVLRLAGGGLALGALGLFGWRAVALGGPGQTASAPPTPSAPTNSAAGPPRASPSSGDEHVT